MTVETWLLQEAQIDEQQALARGLRLFVRTYALSGNDFDLSAKYLSQFSDPHLQALGEFGLIYPDAPDEALQKNNGIPVAINFPPSVQNKLPLSGKLIGIVSCDITQKDPRFSGVALLTNIQRKTFVAVRVQLQKTGVTVSLFPEHTNPHRSTKALVKNLLSAHHPNR